MTYADMLTRLYEHEDGTYRDFHKKLLKNEEINVIGVRMPILRKLSKEWKGEWRELLTFPSEYYEVTFLKCAVVGMLPYEEFIKQVDKVLPLIDNWATCDCFEAPCIKKHREEFLPVLERYLHDGREFIERYALVTLLHYYTEETYLPVIFRFLEGCDQEKYYVMMAAGWLLAEVLVKFYEEGVAFLREGRVSAEIASKGIQKARESKRLNAEQKEFLQSMKRNRLTTE